MPIKELPPVGRFAPTPSGRLHLGNLFCAMIAYLSVRHRGGQFLLRIEDLDRPRCPMHLSEMAIRDLEKMGFTWDGPILFQSQRDDHYEAALQCLRSQGLIYPCFCTRAELHASIAPNLGDTMLVYPGTCARLTPEEVRRKSETRAPALRLRVPDETISFRDRLQGTVSENLLRDCGDFVLRRSDGLWGYQLAVVVDDAQSGVTEVVRGMDLLRATPRQIYLQCCLSLAPVHYMHIPLLLDPRGRRLAKRDRDLSLDVLLEKFRAEELWGFLACAAGFLSAPEPLSLDDLLEVYDEGKLPRDHAVLPEALVR